MHLEDESSDRPLWDLLGRTRKPEVPGHFTDDVLRRIRLEKSQSPEWSLRLWLAESWKILGASTTAMALLTVSLLYQTNHPVTFSMARNDTPDISALLASVPTNALADLSADTSLDDNDIWLGTVSY